MATEPLPVPLPPVVIVIQLALLVALQAQPAVDVTATFSPPPAGSNSADVGDTVNAHDPACVSVTVCPATVSVPVLGIDPGFGATV
jgi:hypothetical protein